MQLSQTYELQFLKKNFTNRYKISDTIKLSKSASHHKCRAASFLLILDNPTRKFPISGFLHFN